VSRTDITGGFWRRKLEMNASKAIHHQWNMLETSGCIENFRIAVGESYAFREGWFFADSDAYKWLEATIRTLDRYPDPELAVLVKESVDLLERAQDADGYLYTFNQVHFPEIRWKNLQIEHELYCHGHLIEAGVSDFELNGESALFRIALRAVDRVVDDFSAGNSRDTPGHEEIEIALLRLYRAAGKEKYLRTAEGSLDNRGRARSFGFSVARQFFRVGRREKEVRRRGEVFLRTHPGYIPPEPPPEHEVVKPAGSILRLYTEALSGRYFQQHTPLRRLAGPAGHAVRFVYLETAAAMLAGETDDTELTALLERSWDRMVTEYMYVTGGLGSVPGTEGFGIEYALNNETAYAETCAALGSIFWSRELAFLTGGARYHDLMEWQLYNAAAVGMGVDGAGYFYHNPLCSRTGMKRQQWYAIPCCPSNISRTWANLHSYIYIEDESGIRVCQYADSRFIGRCAEIDMKCTLPWSGEADIRIDSVTLAEFTICLRIPSWSETTTVRYNGEPVDVPDAPLFPATAAGTDPRKSRWLHLQRIWSAGDRIEICFDMGIKLRHAHPRVADCREKAAVSRGPLVYCLESCDNPGIDIFASRLHPETLDSFFEPQILGGVTVIQARSELSDGLTLIPYFSGATGELPT